MPGSIILRRGVTTTATNLFLTFLQQSTPHLPGEEEGKGGGEGRGGEGEREEGLWWGLGNIIRNKFHTKGGKPF